MCAPVLPLLIQGPSMADPVFLSPAANNVTHRIECIVKTDVSLGGHRWHTEAAPPSLQN